MAQPGVRILHSSSHALLGEELKEWLSETAGRITITGISVDSNDYGHCLALLYTEGPGPIYTPHVLFNSSHGELESEANAVLLASRAGTPRHIALGSNNYGHTLCVIEANQVLPPED